MCHVGMCANTSFLQRLLRMLSTRQSHSKNTCILPVRCTRRDDVAALVHFLACEQGAAAGDPVATAAPPLRTCGTPRSWTGACAPPRYRSARPQMPACMNTRCCCVLQCGCEDAWEATAFTGAPKQWHHMTCMHTSIR